MLLDDYQRAAGRTLHRGLDDASRLLDGAAGLAEEAGEILAHVRKHAFQGRPLDRSGLAEELGDALWCVAAVATAQGLSLGEIAADNLAKLRTRWPDGLGAHPAPVTRDEEGLEGR